MENLTEYKIKLPTLPGEFVFVGVAEIQEGDMIVRHNDNTGEIKWVDARGHWGNHGILARRRDTLADWANKQRLFQALAEMRQSAGMKTILTSMKGDSWWSIVFGGADAFAMNMGLPPINGKLRLEAGKWVDA